MGDSRFTILFGKLLNRTATEEDKSELRGLWTPQTGSPDTDQLFPYEEWQEATAEGPLTQTVQQKTLHYILSKDTSVTITKYRKPPVLLRWFSAAAAVLLLLTGGYWLLQHNTVKEIPQRIVATAMGERKNITLADGSTVYLNGGSSIHFPMHFDETQRSVQLEGEAFFEIAPDSARPFIVQIGGVATTVLGTAFNIAARNGNSNIVVSVKTGKVKVATDANKESNPGEVQLMPGMQAVYNGQQHRLTVSNISVQNAGSWKDNRLVFDNASLAEICLALERKYGVRFEAASLALLHCMYSTSFDGLTLLQSTDKLSLLGNLHFTREDSIITIKGTPCTP